MHACRQQALVYCLSHDTGEFYLVLDTHAMFKNMDIPVPSLFIVREAGAEAGRLRGFACHSLLLLVGPDLSPTSICTSQQTQPAWKPLPEIELDTQPAMYWKTRWTQEFYGACLHREDLQCRAPCFERFARGGADTYVCLGQGSLPIKTPTLGS